MQKRKKGVSGKTKQRIVQSVYRPSSLRGMGRRLPDVLLTASLAAMAATAHANELPPGSSCKGESCEVSRQIDRRVRIDAYGSNGSNGSSLPWKSSKGGNGADGKNRSVIVQRGAGISADTNSAALRVDTSGGKGGDGSRPPIVANGVGGSGGSAGKVSADLHGTVENRNQGVAGHAVELLARGGAAGDGRDANAHASSTLAGNGADITIRTDSGTKLVARGVVANALKADASGGRGGDGRKLAAFWREGGGQGGTGGRITYTGSGALETYGSTGAHAMTLRSAGGEGGVVHGGLQRSGNAGGKGGAAGAITVRFGEQGQAGSRITTRGSNSHGMQLLSMGGAGGRVVSDSAFNGPDGGAGGAGAAVSLTVENATITTSGAHSSGILAESRGGNGYWGGGSTFTKGGTAGAGGAAGRVDVRLGAAVTVATQGTGAHGVQAISKGGGGHNGGEGGIFYSGGRGSVGGAGGEVTLVNAGMISTRGAEAFGLYALSAGGSAGDGGAGRGIVGFGGNGGKASTSGKVVLNNSGKVKTEGKGSHGIFAQSVGGGGGTQAAEDGQQLAIGGKADSAFSPDASGGAIELGNTGVVATSGKSAYGLFAQSIGGGGGNGGASAGIVSIGGKGESGGHGSRVALRNSGRVTTSGESAFGIAAQSIGGGGGNGGGAFAVGLLASVGIGGASGGGGNGGDVRVDHAGELQTDGNNATALLAQSIGGGGGVGGSLATVGVASAATVAVGGSAGNGGAAGTVDVSTAGTIRTRGDNAKAIFAQSIGGGGGTGGNSAGFNIGLSATTVGGSGGGGGAGKAVTINNQARIETTGADSHGIVAQSIGGGGGAGGIAAAANIAIPIQGFSFAVSTAIGGAGGAGGAGGDVKLISKGAIATEGRGARGLLAQSVGGGGGIGGSAASAAIAAASNTSLAIATSIGGAGGKGGAGKFVNVDNSHQISTKGAFANAMTAQSIGGGGGVGGAGVVGLLSVSFQSIGVAVGVGGKGGDGGAGGEVDVGNTGAVSTRGAFSRGILAQSIGGGGGEGNGGDAHAYAQKASASVGLGGQGGEGGSGSTITVRNQRQGSIATAGRGADAIVAQSIGGGGGVGGIAGAATGIEWPDLPPGYTPPSPPLPDGRSASVALALGGSAGKGGSGAKVVVENAGSLLTQGHLASGIVAQSIGGGGGKAGVAKSSAGEAEVSIGLALGGKGGDGGQTGEVNVGNTGSIETRGEYAYAILAQSIGGGGGAGGSLESGAAGAKLAVDVAIGGLGGKGGSGAAVKVTNAGSLSTLKSGAIVAQSIGGGGGEGGFAAGESSGEDDDADGVKSPNPAAPASLAPKSLALTIGLGGKGGTSGSGGAVTVVNRGDIVARGVQSSGILAQSVGGGGGKGGGSSSFAGGAATNLALSLGGMGGAAGSGGHVAVENRGRINTYGTQSHGVHGQSIGGGGGAGGSAGLELGGLSLGLGGLGRTGGNGGQVTLSNSAIVFTQGQHAAGLYGQSIGGGGGDGGAVGLKVDLSRGTALAGHVAAIGVGGMGGASGHGGAVEIRNEGNGLVQTTGDNADALLLQSIGGGGGTAVAGESLSRVNAASGAKEPDVIYERVQVDLGGRGATNGNGGALTAMNGPQASILTQGDRAAGILAQSVGGGGGKAVFGTAHADAGMNQWGIPWQSADIAVGGTAQAQGNGGAVDIVNQGGIQTEGQASHAVFAQSIGGGGGSGALVGDRGYAAKVGEGGGKGSGAAVTIANSGAIVTTGKGAHGILAQSIGGGGGYAGYNSAFDFNKPTVVTAGKPGGEGSGGKVSIKVDGTVSTQGKSAAGILAQSLGGGGGIGTDGAVSAGGKGQGGALDVTVNGRVLAYGENAPGVYAQSTGGTGASSITVRVGSQGEVQGGSGDGAAAIVLSDGADNHIEIARGGKVWALSEQAIRNLGPVTIHINNHGTLAGSVDLGRASGSTFVNNPGALYAAGAKVNLGSGNTLLNHGVLSPGGAQRYMTTTIDGGYTQRADATLESDVDFLSGQRDVLTVAGKADLDGTIRTLGRNPLPGRDYTIVESTGPQAEIVAKAGLRAEGTLVYSYQLKQLDSKRLAVGVDADFRARDEWLSDDDRAKASYLQQRWSDVPVEQLASFAPVFDAFAGVRTLEEYHDALESISSDATQGPAADIPLSSRTFVSRMMSCPEFEGSDAAMREGDCFWGRIMGRQQTRDSVHDDNGFENDALTYQIGGQKEVAPGWFLGGSVAYEDSRIKATDQPIRTDGGAVQAGVVLKRQAGPWLFAGSLSAGYGSYDTARHVRIGSTDLLADSSWRSRHVGARMRASYVHAMPNWYLKPSVDLDLVYQRVPGYQEKGAGAFNLHTRSADQTSFMLTPAIELGGRIDLKKATLRPYASLGVGWLSDSRWNTEVRLEGEPTDQYFRVSTSLPQTYGELKLGVELLSRDGVELKAEYGQRFANNYTDRYGELRMAIHF